MKRIESVLVCSVLSAVLLASSAQAASPIQLSDAFKAKLRQAVGKPNKLEALGVRARFGHSRSGATASAVRAAATASVRLAGCSDTLGGNYSVGD